MFTQYIDRFLSLLERFVVSHEKQTELMAGRAVAVVGEASQTAPTPEPQAEPQQEEQTTGRRGRRTRAEVAGGGEPAPEPEATPEPEQETTGRRGRRRATDKQEDTPPPAQETEQPAATGRRGRRRAAEAEPQEEAKAPKMTPEQAEQLAEIERLAQLAGDVDNAAADVKDYYADNGWSVAGDIPTERYEDALTELNNIIDYYFD